MDNMAKTETYLCLEQWHQGKSKGLETLLGKHIHWIREKVRKRISPKLRKMVESTDIVQEAAMEFFQYGPRICISNDRQFRALLSRIIENNLCDKHAWFTARRRAMARQRPLLSDTMLDLDAPRGTIRTPSQDAIRNEREAWIQLGMELIDPKDREIIILRQWDRLAFAEVGKAINVNADAARMRYNRAVTRLGEKVGELRRGELLELEGETDEEVK